MIFYRFNSAGFDRIAVRLFLMVNIGFAAFRDDAATIFRPDEHYRRQAISKLKETTS